MSTIIFMMSSPLPYRFGFDRNHARHLLRFGLPLALSSVLVFAIGYSDQLIAGTFSAQRRSGSMSLLSTWHHGR